LIAFVWSVNYACKAACRYFYLYLYTRSLGISVLRCGCGHKSNVATPTSLKIENALQSPASCC